MAWCHVWEECLEGFSVPPYGLVCIDLDLQVEVQLQAFAYSGFRFCPLFFLFYFIF